VGRAKLKRIVDDSTYFCECDKLYGFASGDQGDSVTVNSSCSCYFSDFYLDNLLSHFFVRNHPAVAVFRAPEIHHTDIVALLPTA